MDLRSRNAISLTVLLCLQFLSIVVCRDYDAYANTVASTLSKHLMERTKKITNYHKIKEDLDAIESKSTKVKLDGREIILTFKKDIERIFEEKAEALRNIKNRAEEAKAQHIHDENIEKFRYPNIHIINEDEEYNNSLQVHVPFSTDLLVSMNRSFVQVPTNIYANSSDVLNTVKWTEKLDEVFKDNYFNQSNETLLHQYYGDQSGLMRLYPGSKFGVEGDEVDLFDCRRRPWYIQASASPKDIVIIIDKSGSMKGSNIGIARIAAGSLIDTLSENDYFNVITINEKACFIKSGCEHLIQATKLNKEAMKLALQDIGKPEKNASPEKAIEKAFQILNSGAKYNHTTASCNKAIMFISDGIEGENVAEAEFKKYNANKTVRAFAFFVGRTHVNVGKKALLQMSCDNRGYFYPVESVGNIWDTVLQYLQVMSRPLNVTRNDYTAKYSPMYLDSGGLGMIMTMSMSVFDKNGFIGVAGTDITLGSLLQQVPEHKFGPFSYIFIINNNGFVLMHPKLKEQKGYLVAPRNVFLEDLVRGTSAESTKELKKKMIDQEKNGQMDFPVYWLHDNDHKCAQIKAKVFFEPIDGTDFSAGILMADSEASQMKYSDEDANDWLSRGIKALEVPKSDDGEGFHNVLIALWDYCVKPYEKTTAKNIKSYYSAAELKAHLNFLKGKTIDNIPSNCNIDLLKSLLVTAGVANERVSETWKSEILNDALYQDVFVTTNGGYAKYYSMNETYYTEEFKKPPHFEMAAALSSSTISVSVPYVYSDRFMPPPSYIKVSAAVKVGKENVLTVVSGMRIRNDFFQDIFKTATSVGDKYCDSNENTICALIDQNGYIVSSNLGNRYIGRFIGEVSSILVQKLSEVGIFKKILLEDTQSECDQPESEKSSSTNLFTPLRLLYQAFQGMAILFQTLSWMVFQYSTFLLHPVEGENQKENQPPIKISCTLQMPFYVFQPDKNRTKWVKCDDQGCNLIYWLETVKDTNLLFLFATSVPSCKRVCIQPHKNLAHTRNSSNIEQRVCKIEQRYRRTPSACYNEEIPNENIMCGGTELLKPSVPILLILICVYYFF